MPEKPLNPDEMYLEDILKHVSNPQVFKEDERMMDALKTVNRWEKKMEQSGYTIADGLMFGSKTFREYMQDWDYDVDELRNNEKVRLAAFLMDGLDKNHGYKDRLSPPTTALLPMGAGSEGVAVEERAYKGVENGLAKESEYKKLTRWDRFWKALGITTSRVRYNQMLDRTKAAIRENAEKVRVLERTNGASRNRYLKENEGLYAEHTGIRQAVAAETEKWNELFFGKGEVPEPYRFLDGTTVSPLAACMGMLDKVVPDVAKEIIKLTPEEVAQNEELMESVKAVADDYRQQKIYEQEAIEEAKAWQQLAGTYSFRKFQDLDEDMKKLLRPKGENAGKALVVVPEDKKELSKEDVIRYTPMLQVKQELREQMEIMGERFAWNNARENRCVGLMEETEKFIKKYEDVQRCEITAMETSEKIAQSQKDPQKLQEVAEKLGISFVQEEREEELEGPEI